MLPNIRGRKASRRLFVYAAALSATLAAGSAHALQAVSSFGSNPGALKMNKYVPAGLASNAPLVVAMHGCMQDVGTYHNNTGWKQLADKYRFAVVYPQQVSGNNSSTCFNWFEPGDIERDRGEALSIKQMVDKMKADHAVDPSRVFVTGLSAGGWMVNVMLATYPDVFAGGAPIAGGPYKCALDMNTAFQCMLPGKDLPPAQWGDNVRKAYAYSGKRPKVSIWHGDGDWVVRPMNQTEQVEQWANVFGIDMDADINTTVKAAQYKGYRDGNGELVLETYTIPRMGHGVPVDQGTGIDQCGSVGSSVIEADICSSYHIAKFWGLIGGDTGDTEAPVVDVTGPANGNKVSGIVTLRANASDNVGVVRVDFYVGSKLVGSATQAPFSVSWDSRTVSNGNHTVSAKAYDAAGNVGVDSDTQISVENEGGGNTLYCGSATNAEHKADGRALGYGSGAYASYLAKGTYGYMGLGDSKTTTLKETKAGVFSVVTSCQ